MRRTLVPFSYGLIDRRIVHLYFHRTSHKPEKREGDLGPALLVKKYIKREPSFAFSLADLWISRESSGRSLVASCVVDYLAAVDEVAGQSKE